MQAIRIHYNFCRQHQTLGKTPAEVAGIKLELQRNKAQALMKLASEFQFCLRVIFLLL